MFSDEVLEYKDSLGPGSDIASQTNNYFRKEYFENPTPERKFSPPFIPGEIYFFRYQTDTKVSKERPFIDRLPVLLCTDVFDTEKAGTVVKGIDLIVVPPRIRIDILSKFTENYKGEIQANDQSYEKGAGKIPIKLTDPVLNTLLRGTGFKQALFGFKYRFIRNPGVLPSEDWSKLPYLSYNLVEGSPIQGIYKEYQTKLNL